MRTYILLVCLIGLPVLAYSQENPNWLRYPAISPDGSAIVLTYKGDLYRVRPEGGQAQQLTFHEAHDFRPVWSNDGAKIAFASDRYGNFDIYVDRKSTRLNSSHVAISYAVFCLKKKKKLSTQYITR